MLHSFHFFNENEYAISIVEKDTGGIRSSRISHGTVTVTCIIKVGRGYDRQFDLLRVIAVELREHNVDVESFAAFI